MATRALRAWSCNARWARTDRRCWTLMTTSKLRRTVHMIFSDGLDGTSGPEINCSIESDGDSEKLGSYTISNGVSSNRWDQIVDVIVDSGDGEFSWIQCQTSETVIQEYIGCTGDDVNGWRHSCLNWLQFIVDVRSSIGHNLNKIMALIKCQFNMRKSSEEFYLFRCSSHHG